jgi:hypothetical protein
MFVFLAIVFTVVVGLFIGCMFTTSMNGWKRGLVTLAIAVCVGCGISAMFCAERNSDVKAWNNGSCECGGTWEFSNAEHLRNSGNFYYWYCEDCGRVIELHTQFTK